MYFIIGAFTSTATNPIWVIKTRLQLQGANGMRKYSGSLDCFFKIVRQEGFRGLYKGMSASYLGTVFMNVHIEYFYLIFTYRCC